MVKSLQSRSENWGPSNSVLVDTSLLVLLVVGATDRNLIAKHKRTRSFIPRDYDELSCRLSTFRELWVTTHCLAETSNLLKQTDQVKARILLHNLAICCRNANESHIRKELIFSLPEFLTFGVTDSGFIQSTENVSLAVTADLSLYLAISKLGRRVINFNHFRESYLN